MTVFRRFVWDRRSSLRGWMVAAVLLMLKVWQPKQTVGMEGTVEGAAEAVPAAVAARTGADFRDGESAAVALTSGYHLAFVSNDVGAAVKLHDPRSLLALR